MLKQAFALSTFLYMSMFAMQESHPAISSLHKEVERGNNALFGILNSILF
jgi:hypothetical protein